LPPHYICSNCKYVEFSNNEIDNGYDLPTKKCPKCNKKLNSDGHNLPFETFLGTENAAKVPDIDLNFSGEYQPIIHNFIKDMFDKNHAFRAGTISTVAEKTAEGLIRNYYEAISPNCKINYAQIKYITSKCIDVKRTVGQHPGGIIVIPKENDICDFTPYNFPPDDFSGE
jgi:DNA polymerase-3 subunit alpha (Gram-positive type)